jgi:hypothetical protein
MSEITKTNLNTRLTELEKAFKALLLDLYPEKKTAVEVIFPKPEPKPEPIRVSGPIVVGKSQSDQFVIDTLRGELASANSKIHSITGQARYWKDRFEAVNNDHAALIERLTEFHDELGEEIGL